MINPIRIPLLTAIYALVGVGLAALSYRGHWWVSLICAAVALTYSLVCVTVGDRLITTRPRQALAMYESRSVATGMLSAVASCAVVLIAVSLGKVGGEADPSKTVFATLTSAVTALIAGVFVSAKDSDQMLGKAICRKFQEHLRGPRGADETKVQILESEVGGAAAVTALFTSYANGWTDWTRDNRHARVAALQTWARARQSSPGVNGRK